MKKIFILSALLSINISHANASSSDQATQKKEQQTAFIEKMRSSLTECKSLYRLDVIGISLRQRAIEVNGEAQAAFERVNRDHPGELSPPKPIPVRDSKLLAPECVGRKKVEVMALSKSFLSSFKSAGLKSQAKITIAQWITVMDTIGKEINEAEDAKLQTLVNGIIIEM